jgi:hypothetical protein
VTTQAPKLDAEESKLLTKVMTLGTGTNLPVVMTPSELAKLIGVVYRDTNQIKNLEKALPEISAKIVPDCDYYSIPDGWFTQPVQIGEFEHIELMRLGTKQIPDFVTYLRARVKIS